MEILVKTLEKENDGDLIAFLDDLSSTNDSVLGYHYPFYREMLEKCEVGTALYLGAYIENSLQGVLPGFVKEGNGGKVYSSLPFFGPNASIIVDQKFQDRITQELLLHLEKLLKKENYISVSMYSPFMENTSTISEKLREKFPIEVKKHTNFIRLNDLKISSKIKYDLRKAEKAGVLVDSIVTEKKLNDLYNIYLQNCADFNIPVKPFSCIEYLAFAAKNTNKVSFYFSMLDDEVIGGLIMIWSNGVASYYLPCAKNEHRTLQANSLLISVALKETQERRVRIWNWESSPSQESGVYKFKKKWGGTDGCYSIFVKPFKDESFFEKLGPKKIADQFPYFFVYPFNMIK